MDQFNLGDVIKNKTILDVGSSTGGFSHCLLEKKAKLVISLDVGYNQLDWKLRKHPNIISVEKTDIRAFQYNNYPDINFITADISFNSLVNLSLYLTKPLQKGYILLLVKPQFELPKQDVPAGGVVTSKIKRQEALSRVKQTFKEQGLTCLNEMECPIPGKCGNIEYFLLLEKKSS